MGSITEIIDCPNCGQDALDEVYYKTGEEYIFCGSCGYNKSATIKNRDKLLTELTEEDWEYTELLNPYGAFEIRGLNSIATECGSFKNEQDYLDFKSILPNDYEVEFCQVSRLVNGKIEVETLIDNKIKTNE